MRCADLPESELIAPENEWGDQLPHSGIEFRGSIHSRHPLPRPVVVGESDVVQVRGRRIISAKARPRTRDTM